MKLRYTLEARKPGRVWRRVAAPELGAWAGRRTSATTRFISERRVTQLARAVVLPGAGAVPAGSMRTAMSLRPRQVAARPRAGSPTTGRTSSCASSRSRARRSYVALVANTGRSPTGAVRSGDHPACPQPSLAHPLAPGEERLVEADRVRVRAEAAPVTATADPLDLIDERNERDNAVTRRCPVRSRQLITAGQ